jgi:hypothetical protein
VPDQWSAKIGLQVSDNWQGLAESPLELRSGGRPSCDRVHAGVSAETRKLVQPSWRSAKRTSRLGGNPWPLEDASRAEVRLQECHGRLPNKALQRTKA